MRLLLTAVVRFLPGGVLGPLATAFSAVDGQFRRTLEGQGRISDPARLAFRGEAERG
jgi:hypothetical protein